MKQLIQQQGICPVCGSPDLDYDSSEFDGIEIGYPWGCKRCKSTGTEWYTLTFVEHTNVEDNSNTDDDEGASNDAIWDEVGYFNNKED